MNALGVAILFFVLCLIFSGSRHRAFVGMTAGILYLTQAQQIEVLGFNIFAYRIIELAGFVRVLLRKEVILSRPNQIDRALLGFIVYTTIIYLFRAREGLAFYIGWAADCFLCYFSFRGLISEWDDLRPFLVSLVFLLIPFMALAVYESVTKANPFAFIGGRMGAADMVREGRMRAAGSFRHASLLGTVGSTFAPLFVALALDKAYRNRAILGFGACIGIVWASNSGGPISCLIAGLLGWLLWRFRGQMKWVRRGSVVCIVALALYMKAPIWYLIAKMSSFTGGDGWHRSHLLEQGFAHLDLWWLAGMPVKGTQEWFPYYIHGTGGADITNQFLYYGIAAGFGSMVLFIFLLIQAFRSLGRALAAARVEKKLDKNDELLLWGLGVMLSVHMFNWLSITYFDQSYALWYSQLAMIAAAQTITGANSPSSSPG